MISCFRKTRSKNTNKGVAGSRYTVCVKKTMKASKSKSASPKSASKSKSASPKSASKSKSASPKLANTSVRRSKRVKKNVKRLTYN